MFEGVERKRVGDTNLQAGTDSPQEKAQEKRQAPSRIPSFVGPARGPIAPGLRPVRGRTPRSPRLQQTPPQQRACPVFAPRRFAATGRARPRHAPAHAGVARLVSGDSLPAFPALARGSGFQEPARVAARRRRSDVQSLSSGRDSRAGARSSPCCGPCSAAVSKRPVGAIRGQPTRHRARHACVQGELGYARRQWLRSSWKLPRKPTFGPKSGR